MAAVIFASCKEEEKSPEITLEKDSVTLTSGGEFLINATSDYDLTFKSEDEYHAKVDEKGLVTAKYIGETNIVVSNSENSKKVKITVEPKYDICEDLCPYLGKTKSQILSKFGDNYTLDENYKNYITYVDYTSYIHYLTFRIENDVVIAIAISVNKSYSPTLEGYLKERYVFKGKEPDSVTEDYVYSYVGIYEGKRRTEIIMTGYDDTYLAVIYRPYKSSK